MPKLTRPPLLDQAHTNRAFLFEPVSHSAKIEPWCKWIMLLMTPGVLKAEIEDRRMYGGLVSWRAHELLGLI